MTDFMTLFDTDTSINLEKIHFTGAIAISGTKKPMTFEIFEQICVLWHWNVNVVLVVEF